VMRFINEKHSAQGFLFRIMNQQPLSDIVAMLTMGMLSVWVLFGPVICMWFLYEIIVEQSAWFLVAFVLIISTGFKFFPAQIYWPEFTNHPFWQTWRNYFNFRVVYPNKPFNYNKQYMLAEFPHGVFPMGALLAGTIFNQPEKFNGNLHGMVASVLFRVPLLRQLFSWLGARPASRSVVMNYINRGKTVCIMPGGIAEIFLCNENEERIYLANRKGFVRCAIEGGVDLVPVYFLGNTTLLSFYNSETMARLSRKYQTSLLVYWGRWFLPIPYKQDIVMLLGEPIPVKKNENPTEEEVDALHARFMDELKELYNNNRHRVAGWENRELVIM